MATQDRAGTPKFAADFDTPTQADWQKLVEKALKGADFEKRLVSKTADGLSINPLYTRDDELPGTRDAIPGAPPLTRGTHTSVSGLGWDIRQLHAEIDPNSANKFILADLEAGVSSITLRISAPGRNGLPAASEAIKTALKGVRLDWAPVAFEPGPHFQTVFACLQEILSENAGESAKFAGALNADPLGEFARTGTHTESHEDIAAQLAACVGLAAQHYPTMKTLLADGRCYHEAGATEAQELAFMAATCVQYLRDLEDHGIPANQAVRSTAFALTAEADIFMTIAKLRAARRIIWRIADAAGAGEAAASIHITASTSERMMTRRDPWNNLLRATSACAAAAIGGADAITVLPFTWPLGKSDAFAYRTARNTQIVCQEESSLGRVIDPAGGAWHLEKLTNDLAQKAWTTFQEIEAKGGIPKALKSGFIQDAIAKQAQARAERLATGREPLTGTSTFPLLGDDGVTVEPHDDVPAINDDPQIPPLTPHRLAEPFEIMRDRADAHEAKTGQPPCVFLASLGTIAEHTQRSTWTKNLLASGGIEALANDGFSTADDASASFKDSGASAACICSSDTIYAEQAEAMAKALKEAGAQHVYLAGRPGDMENNLTSAGVTRFLFAGQNAITTLEAILDDLNVVS